MLYDGDIRVLKGSAWTFCTLLQAKYKFRTGTRAACMYCPCIKYVCFLRSREMERQELREIWNEIKKFVELNPGWYRTRLKNGGQGVPFKAENIHGRIRITIQSDKVIGYLRDDDFLALYPLYLRREKGEAVSGEAGKVNRRPIYFWGLIYWAYEQKRKPQM